MNDKSYLYILKFFKAQTYYSLENRKLLLFFRLCKNLCLKRKESAKYRCNYYAHKGRRFEHFCNWKAVFQKQIYALI